MAASTPTPAGHGPRQPGCRKVVWGRRARTTQPNSRCTRLSTPGDRGGGSISRNCLSGVALGRRVSVMAPRRCVGAYVCARECVDACARACKCVCIKVCVYVCVHLRMCISIHMRLRMRAPHRRLTDLAAHTRPPSPPPGCRGTASRCGWSPRRAATITLRTLAATSLNHTGTSSTPPPSELS